MGTAKKHIPIRTCISCGSKRKKYELVRLVLNEKGQLERDIHGRRPGRGAYVCENRTCIDLLKNNRRLQRTLKSEKAIDASLALKDAEDIAVSSRKMDFDYQ